jgi:hypothetical protein
MGLVLVEGEVQIAQIVNTPNASTASTGATSDSTSPVVSDTHRRTTMVFFTVLGVLLIVLL